MGTTPWAQRMYPIKVPFGTPTTVPWANRKYVFPTEKQKFGYKTIEDARWKVPAGTPTTTPWSERTFTPTTTLPPTPVANMRWGVPIGTPTTMPWSERTFVPTTTAWAEEEG